MLIKNTQVFGFADSVRESGFPKALSFDREIYKSDWNRAERLAQAPNGSGHDSFLKGIQVHMVIQAPQYFWLQFQRYHFADIVSSQSKMHTILEMDIDDQCNEHVLPVIIDKLQELIIDYKDFKVIGDTTIGEMNDILQKKFQRILSNTPMGLELRAGVVTNYLQLKSMYKQRRNHRTQEWQQFCDWIEDLPYSEWITGKED